MSKTLEEILEEDVQKSNATAWVPGIGIVGAYIDPKTGKTQNELPVGSVVTPNGSKNSWEITGGTAGNYTSKLVENKTDDTAGTNTAAGTPTTQTAQSIYGKIISDYEKGTGNLTQMAVNQLESQKKGVHSAYDATARNAYTNYMMNNKDLNENLVRSGLSQGGMSESSQVASNAAYGAELMQNETSRNKAISDIDSQIADVRYKDAAALLETKHNLNLEELRYNRDIEAQERQHRWDVEDAERDRAWAEADRADTNYHNYQANALDTLAKLAEMGVETPDEALLKAAGLTMDNYNSMKKYFKNKNIKVSTSSSSSSTSSGKLGFGSVMDMVMLSDDPEQTLRDNVKYLTRTEYETIYEVVIGELQRRGIEAAEMAESFSTEKYAFYQDLMELRSVNAVMKMFNNNKLGFTPDEIEIILRGLRYVAGFTAKEVESIRNALS